MVKFTSENQKSYIIGKKIILKKKEFKIIKENKIKKLKIIIPITNELQ